MEEKRTPEQPRPNMTEIDRRGNFGEFVRYVVALILVLVVVSWMWWMAFRWFVGLVSEC